MRTRPTCNHPDNCRNGHLTYFEPFNALFVNSHGSSSVYKVGLEDRIVSRIAGTGQRGNADGPAGQSTFSRPNGVALSSTGDTLYLNSSIPTVDDPGNNHYPLNPSVIRMIAGIRGAFTSAGGLAPMATWHARVFPNPSHGALGLELELETKDELQVSVLDSAGKEIYTETWGAVPTGLLQKTLNLAAYPAGQYYLMVSGRKQGQALPFQLVK